MPIGLMSAMTEELESLIPALEDASTGDHGMRSYYRGRLFGQQVVLVFSRWGKVAAATTATTLMTRYGCEEIIFTGVAGGVAHGLRVGDVVVAERLVQHDMDARPIFPQHEIPLLGATEFVADERRGRQLAEAARSFLADGLGRRITNAQRRQFGIKEPKVTSGLITSGDKFFASKEDLNRLRTDIPTAACVEMEGAAMAQVCHEHGVPFSVVRTISDSADDDAHMDFQAFVKDIATVYSHGILERLFA